MKNKIDKIKYKRLVKQRLALLFPGSLWLGPDHLLLVTSWGVGEEYKRFYLEDIQAVVMTGTSNGWKIWNVVTGLLGGVFALIALLSNGGTALFNWIIAVPIILFFMVNLFSGPTCDCYIQTAVQKEKLYPVKRIRTFRKVAELIKPLIEQHQGRLEPETLEKYMSGLKHADVDTAEML